MAKTEKKEKILEITAQKGRKKEERFFIHYFEMQANTVLLFILSATFLITSAITFLKEPQFIIWLALSIAFFTLSILLVTVANVLIPLNIKRTINIFAFVTYLLGALIFFIALINIIVALV